MSRAPGRGLAAALLGCALLAGCLEEPAPLLAPEGNPGTSPDRVPPRVLVVNGLSETLSSFDIESGVLTVQAATLGTWPNRVSPWRAGRAVMVTSSGDNALAIYDARDLNLKREIDLGPGRNPWAAEDAGENAAVVTNWLSGDVQKVRIDHGIVLPAIAVSPGPEGFVLVGSLAWVACTNFLGDEGRYGPGLVEVVDLDRRTVLETIEVGRNPQAVLAAADGRIHVLCTGTYGDGSGEESGRVSVIDPLVRAEVARIEIGGSPGSLAEAPDGTIWVAGHAGGIRRYDASTLELLPDPVAPELASPGFSGIAVDEVSGTVWAVNFEADLLVAIEPTEGALDGIWLVGDGPVDVGVFRFPDPAR